MTQIFIVDDHPIMRESLRALLEREADLAVCGEAATAHATLDALQETLPDLVLIDVSLPGMSGIELARVLREQYPGLFLAMLSGHKEKSHVDQALDAGVQGYILKGKHDELPTAIRQIAQGETYLSTEIRRSGLDTS